ncbi:MAG: hypothetical protein JXR72_04625 [Proteobacteria bacterium]|nr:hypothetical protein [Pseudomonadota bacterium]
MKKFGVSFLVVLLALGLMVAFAGCGDDDDDDNGLPKSDAAYAGSNEPAYIGSDFGEYYGFALLDAFVGFLESASYPPIGDLAEGSGSSSEFYSNEGSGGGLFEESYESSEEMTEAGYSWEGVYEAVFSDYVDDGEAYPNILEGDGSIYAEMEESGIFTYYTNGLEPLADGSGYPLPEFLMEYINYDDLSLARAYDSGATESYAGYLSQTHTADWETGLCDSSFEGDLSYSWASSEFAGYEGVLDSEGLMAYDGTDTTFQAAGRYCIEGDFMSYILGCMNFEVDVVWENEQFCAIEEFMYELRSTGISAQQFPEEWPDSGTVTVDNRSSDADTIFETAMYDFGATTEPGCYKYLVDADNEPGYEFSTEVCYSD